MKRISSLIIASLLAAVLILGLQAYPARTATNPDNTVPIGTIVPYAGSVKGNARGQLANQGWLVCDGDDSVSRKDYAELFDVIGNFYGSGDGAKTFTLPDFRGRFLRGVDDGAGRDPDAKSRTASAQGGNTGDKVGSAQEDRIGSHSHPHNHPLYIQDNHSGSESWGLPKGTQGSTAGSHERWTANSDAPFSGSETRPKNIYVNYIIKAKDV